MEAVILGDGGPVYLDIVKVLLDAGADPSIPDNDGVTPLEHARTRGFDALADLTANARPK
jgi:ankyrin repeat protein